MIISPADSWVSIPFKFDLMERANSDFYCSTVQLLYFPRVDVVGGVTLDAAAEYFCKSWDFDISTADIPTSVLYEASSVVVVIVTVVIEVGIMFMLTVVLDVGVGDDLGEVLVVGR